MPGTGRASGRRHLAPLLPLALGARRLSAALTSRGPPSARPAWPLKHQIQRQVVVTIKSSVLSGHRSYLNRPGELASRFPQRDLVTRSSHHRLDRTSRRHLDRGDHDGWGQGVCDQKVGVQPAPQRRDAPLDVYVCGEQESTRTAYRSDWSTATTEACGERGVSQSCQQGAKMARPSQQ